MTVRTSHNSRKAGIASLGRVKRFGSTAGLGRGPLDLAAWNEARELTDSEYKALRNGFMRRRSSCWPLGSAGDGTRTGADDVLDRHIAAQQFKAAQGHVEMPRFGMAIDRQRCGC